MKILLISGHGAGDPGATAKINGKTYKEAVEAIVMVNKIKEQLAAYNVTVDIYPTERNAYEDAKAGKLQVDLSKYNYVLEIHFNACVNDLKGNGKVTGSEAFVTTLDKTKTVENDMLDCLAGIGLKKRSVKSHNYTIIYRAKVSGADSCLLEVCFIDDADDMAIYLKDKDKVARAIASGLVKGYNLKKKAGYTGTLPTLPAKGYLAEGDKGEAVTLLKKFLNWWGGYNFSKKNPGSFGPACTAAVNDFKRTYKLAKMNGHFGRKCLKTAETLLKK